MAKQRIIPIIYKVDYKQVDQSTAAVKKAEQATDKLNKEIGETGPAANKSFGAIKNAIVATGIIALVGTLSKKIFDLGVAQEQTTIAFNTFLGSAEKAKVLLRDLTKFSIETPFTGDQVTKAARSLLAFGVEANKIIPTLKILGDVSAGTGKDLAEMAIIFGQIRSTGRLMGQDLLQLINAGFNPLQIIAEKTGKSMGLLKQEMEKGLISFDMVEQAFKDATSAGGLFFNLMEAQSKTVGGKLSTFAGNLDEVGKAIFKLNSGAISSLVDKLVKVSEGLLAFFESSEERQSNILDREIKKFDEYAKGFDKPVDAIESYNTTVRTNLKLLEERYKFNLDIINQEVTLADRISGNVQKIEQAKAAAELRNEVLRDEIEAYNILIPAIEKHVKEVIPEEIKKTKEVTEVSKDRAKALAEINKQLGIMTAAQRVSKRKSTEDRGESAPLPDFQFDSEFTGAMAMQDLLLASFIVFENKKTDAAREAAEERKEIAEDLFDFSLDAIGAMLLANEESQEVDLERLRAGYDEQRRLAGDNMRAQRELDLRQAQEEKRLRDKQLEDEKKQVVRRILIETVLNAVKALGKPVAPNFHEAAKATAYGLLGAGLARRYKKGVIDIDGPGTGTSDSIPSYLSKGESVMTARETVESNGILKAIRAKKLDDKMLEKLYKKANMGGDGLAFSDRGIIDAIKNQPKTDYTKIGSYIYEVKTKNGTHKQFIRKKYFG